jgi:hypothetical protein
MKTPAASAATAKRAESKRRKEKAKKARKRGGEARGPWVTIKWYDPRLSPAPESKIHKMNESTGRI